MTTRDNSKLLNYTTEIELIKTACEIMALLAIKGAHAIMIDYKQGEPTGLSLKIVVNEQEVAFRLPCSVEGAYKAMQRLVVL